MSGAATAARQYRSRGMGSVSSEPRYGSGLVNVALKLRDRYFPGEPARLGGVRNYVGDFLALPADRRPV